MSQPPSRELSTEGDMELLGGADAVEKTTYVTGQGTSPEASNRGSIPPVSQSTFGSPILWISFIIALIVIVIYSTGFLARP